jgi:hypothetical protein
MPRSPQSHFQRAEAGHNQVHAFYFATPKSARTSQDTVRRTCILVARFSTHLIPDTIDYVVTDSAGLTSTSTRTVIIQPADAPSIVPSADASTTATTATSSVQ